MINMNQPSTSIQENRVRTMLNTLARNTVLDSSPTFIIVELTRRCNLWCRMCRTPSWWKELKSKGHYLGDLKPEILERVYPLVAKALTIYLSFFGEPFVNPHCSRIIRDIRRVNPEIAILLTTNFMLPSERDMANLIHQNVGAINVSMDSPFKEKYEYFRRGASYEQLLHNLDTLAALKAEMGTSHPLTNFSYVVMKPNIGEIADFVDFAVRYRPQWIVFHDIVPNSASPKSLNLSDRDYQSHLDVFLSARETAMAHNISLMGSAVKKFQQFLTSGQAASPGQPEDTLACDEPFRTIAVDADGTISPCCYFRGEVMGNIQMSRFGDIWNNTNYQRLRESLITGNYHAGCRKCMAEQMKVIW